MAGGSEGVTVEHVWDGVLPVSIHKLRSGHQDAVIMVVEDLDGVYAKLVSEEEYYKCLSSVLYGEPDDPRAGRGNTASRGT